MRRQVLCGLDCRNALCAKLFFSEVEARKIIGILGLRCSVHDALLHSCCHAANSDGLILVACEISFVQAQKLALGGLAEPLAFPRIDMFSPASMR